MAEWDATGGNRMPSRARTRIRWECWELGYRDWGGSAPSDLVAHFSLKACHASLAAAPFAPTQLPGLASKTNMVSKMVTTARC